MAWRCPTPAATGQQAPTQLRQRPANVAHRTTTEARQVRVARQSVPLPLSRAAMLQPSNGAVAKLNAPATTTPAQKVAVAPTAPSAEQNSNNDSAVAAGR